MIPKFRAWSIDHQTMLDVYSIFWHPDGRIFIKAEAVVDGKHIDVQGFIGDKLILMQSTGLFDNSKPRKEIFEGDVVRWGMLPNSFEIHHRYAVVERNPDIQFRIFYYIDSRTGEKRMGDNYVFHFGSFIYRNTEDCLEIIGNIHEHPHLVEVGHD